MQFGKLEDLAGVDFSLPADGEYTGLLLGSSNAAADPERARELFVGGTAWGDKGFVGRVYPTGTKPAAFLEAYGRQFNTIELNSTYYRVPDFRQVRKWYTQVPDDFQFCPKVHKAISQSGNLGVHTSQILDFAKAVQGFEHKLGPCFIQLPPTFATDRFDALREFLDAWPPQLRLAVELRDPSWFAGDARANEEVWADLAARGIGTVITDVAGRRDVAHMQLTAPFAVIRWVGNAPSDTDSSRLAAWSQRLAGWFERGLPRAYVFTHEPEAVPSARAASELGGVLRKRYAGDLRVRSPELIGREEAAPPAQRSLF